MEEYEKDPYQISRLLKIHDLIDIDKATIKDLLNVLTEKDSYNYSDNIKDHNINKGRKYYGYTTQRGLVRLEFLQHYYTILTQSDLLQNRYLHVQMNNKKNCYYNYIKNMFEESYLELMEKV